MLARLRTGERIAIGGLAGLIATLFLKWFTASVGSLPSDPPQDGGSGSNAVPIDAGWAVLGRPWLDLLVIAGVVVVIALVMTIRTGPGRPTYGAVVSLIIAGAVSFLVTLLTAIRVLLARPTVEFAWAEDASDLVTRVGTGVDIGGWIGLASLLAILVGLWIAVADDRTDAAESAFDPPAPRPLPTTAPVTPASDDPAPPPAG